MKSLHNCFKVLSYCPYKPISIAILLLFVWQISNSQNILPAYHTKIDQHEINLRKEIRSLNEDIDATNKMIGKINDSSGTEARQDLKNMRTEYEKKKDEAVKEFNAFSASAESNPFISFYGAASIGGGTDFVSAITSSGQMNALVNPVRNLFVGIGANLLYANPGNNVKKDSVVLNSLMFPETGKFGVLGTLAYKFPISRYSPNDAYYRRHFIIPQFSFAYRKVDIDSSSIGFKVLNYNLGIKYQVEAKSKDGEDDLSFSMMLYAHYFNIPDEDAKKFHQLVNDEVFKESNSDAALFAWGIKTSVQYNSLFFYFDIRRVTGTSNFMDDDPFKGTLVNIGFSTWLKLSFSKKENRD